MADLPSRLRDARAVLAQRLGQDGPLSAAEMAAVLRLGGQRAEEDLLKMERGAKAISGPVSVLIDEIHRGLVPETARRLFKGRHSRARLKLDGDAIRRAVAEHGSHSAAARALGCSVSVVSREMNGLR